MTLTSAAPIGQTHDQSTGLMHYGARYYDHAIGRFISADTIIPNPADPQQLNRYSYVTNNPLRYVDPSGHWPFDTGPAPIMYRSWTPATGQSGPGWTGDPAQYMVDTLHYIGGFEEIRHGGYIPLVDLAVLVYHTLTELSSCTPC